MSSVATVDSLSETRSTLADDTTSRSNRRGRSRKRKSGDTVSTEGKNKKRTFDDFFNFCSFVLAYEEQLERQALSNPSLTAPNNHTITMTKGHTVTTHHNNSTHNFTTDHNNTTNHTHTEPTEHPPTDHHPTDHHEHTTHNSTTHNHHHHTTPTSSSSSDSESGEEGERGAHSSTDEKLEYTSEDESWNLVTCFCRRPFAGRPMIECSKCSTWVHLFCAKIRKSAVPEVYTCPKCSTPPGKTSARRSAATSAL